MNRTWVKLGSTAKPGDSKVMLAETVTDWRVGDKVIVTVSRESEDGGSSYRQSARKPRRVQTEERFIRAIDGSTLTLCGVLEELERAKGFEPSTFTLAR